MSMAANFRCVELGHRAITALCFYPLLFDVCQEQDSAPLRKQFDLVSSGSTCTVTSLEKCFIFVLFIQSFVEFSIRKKPGFCWRQPNITISIWANVLCIYYMTIRRHVSGSFQGVTEPGSRRECVRHVECARSSRQTLDPHVSGWVCAVGGKWSIVLLCETFAVSSSLDDRPINLTYTHLLRQRIQFNGHVTSPTFVQIL